MLTTFAFVYGISTPAYIYITFALYYRTVGLLYIVCFSQPCNITGIWTSISSLKL